MPRCCAALLAIVMLPCGLAGAQEDPVTAPARVVSPLDAPEVLPSPAPVIDAPQLPAKPSCDSVDTQEPLIPSTVNLALSEFWGYRVHEAWTSWIVGNGEQYGDFSIGTSPYLQAGVHWGIRPQLGFHWVAGPDRTDMPPLLMDFGMGFQKRAVIGDLAYDVACSFLIASDFEGSSDQGIRFPSHAVGYLAFTETIDLVFGVDFLDREDVRVLPVGGVLWRPDPAVRVELVFPSPRIDFQLTDSQRLYLRGGLGGGTWAVERDSELDDLATYHDLQIAIGLGSADCKNPWTSIEIAYLFDRKLQYTSGPGDYDLNDTVMIRSITRY